MTNIPHGWVQTQLGRLGEYVNGRAFKSTEWSQTGRPIIRIQNLTGSSAGFNFFDGDIEPRYLVEQGDLLVSWSATLGAYFWRGPQAVLNQHIFRVESHIEKRFHKYLLDHVLSALIAKTHGSGMVHITREPFDEQPALLPPLGEQKRIVAAIEEQFSRIDSAVLALERSRAGLDRLWRTNVDQTFEQLIDVPRESGREIFTYVTSGSRGWAKYYSPGGAAFLRVSNVGRGKIRLDLSDVQRVTPPYGAEGRRTLVQSGDVLITITADIGRVGVVPDGFGEGYISQHVAIARPREGVNSEYLAWFISGTDGQRQLTGLQRGMTKVGLGLDDLRSLRIPVPARDTQDTAARRLSRLRNVIDEYRALVAQQIAQSNRLRSSILAAAFTGKLARQDSKDEPAAKLLERIAAERASLNGHKTPSSRRPRTARRKVSA